MRTTEKSNRKTGLKKRKVKTTSLEELKEKYLGKVGMPKRDQYEFELSMELIAETLKEIRKEKDLSQEELGKLIGVQKAQISKLESASNSATIETILKVFKALNARIKFKIELGDKSKLTFA